MFWQFERPPYLIALINRNRTAEGGSWWLIAVIIAVLLAAVLSVSFFFGREFKRLSYGPKLQYGVEGSDLSALVIQKSGRYGYGDAAGSILIEPVYEDARPFFEGLAAVKMKGKYGYIDRAGNTAIPFTFTDALDFHGGRAVVGTKWVSIGFLRYRTDCCIIDRMGNLIKEVDFSPLMQYQLGEYTEGYYTQSYCFMDSGGNILRTNILILSGFHEGLARRVVGGGAGQCFIDKSGNVVLTGFQNAGDFCGGLAPAMTKDEKWGYIDKSGALAIQPEFGMACNFGEGLALVKDTADILEGWAIIDAAGNKVTGVPGEYFAADSFSEGLCAVRASSRERRAKSFGFLWGFIDKTGKLAVECVYDDVTPFKNGVAEVMIDGKIGYIDKMGKYIWDLH